MINEAQIGTKPAPGVMATSPTTRPVTHPTSVGFSAIRTSISSIIRSRRCNNGSSWSTLAVVAGAAMLGGAALNIIAALPTVASSGGAAAVALAQMGAALWFSLSEQCLEEHLQQWQPSA